MKAPVPFLRAHLHDLNTSQSPHIIISSNWVLGVQRRNCGGGPTNIQSIVITSYGPVTGLDDTGEMEIKTKLSLIGKNSYLLTLITFTLWTRHCFKRFVL